jgi:hypothetical protein
MSDIHIHRHTTTTPQPSATTTTTTAPATTTTTGAPATTTTPQPGPTPAGYILGAPKGTIPTDLKIAYGRGGPWKQVNQDDPFFVQYGHLYNVPPEWLKSMQVVETGA